METSAIWKTTSTSKKDALLSDTTSLRQQMSYFRCRRLVRNDLVACQGLHHAVQACRRTTRQPRAFTFFTWRSVCDSCIPQKKLRRKIAHFPLIKWLAAPNPPGSEQLSDLSGHPSPSLDKRPTTTLASKQRFLQTATTANTRCMSDLPRGQ